MPIETVQQRGNRTAADAIETLIWAACNDVPETVADLAAHWAPISAASRQARIQNVMFDILPVQSIQVADVQATQPDVLQVKMRLERPDSTIVTRTFKVTQIRGAWYTIW
jgi:hypothetical protein